MTKLKCPMASKHYKYRGAGGGVGGGIIYTNRPPIEYASKLAYNDGRIMMIVQ